MLAQLSRAASRFLIRLHPDGFRETFGEEIEAVIDARLEDAQRAGGFALAQVCVQEVIGLVGNLMTERTLSQQGGSPMNGVRRSQLLCLSVPLGLAIVLLILNPNFVMHLFTSGLGWIITLTFVLAVVLIGLIVAARVETGGMLAAAALAGLLASGCLLAGPPFVMVMDFDPSLRAAEMTVLGVLIVVDVVMLAGIGRVVIGMNRVRQQV